MPQNKVVLEKEDAMVLRSVYEGAVKIALIQEKEFMEPHLKPFMAGRKVTAKRLKDRGIERNINIKTMEVFYSQGKERITPIFKPDFEKILNGD